MVNIYTTLHARPISDIAVDDNGHIYLSVNSKGLLVSRDGGSSWNDLSLPVDTNPLFFYSISKGSDGRLYSIYSSTQVFAYDNRDGQWTEISGGLEGPLDSKPGIWQVLPSASGYVYALTPYYIARSIEKSATRVVSQRTQDRADDFALAQNYPNPFNAGTVISYHCPGKNHVTLKIYNLLGREVDTLVAEIQEAGRHSVKWQAGEFPSGLYIYTLQIGSQVERKKMLLVK